MDLNRPAPPLLARILLAVTALLLVGVVYLFASNVLEEPPQAMPPPLRQAQNFNPRADVSKNQSFIRLQNNHQDIPDLPLGRDNPFVIPKSAAATQTPTTSAKTVTLPGSGIKVVPVGPAASTATASGI